MLPLATRRSFFAGRWSWWEMSSDSGIEASGYGYTLDRVELANQDHVVFGHALYIFELGLEELAEGGFLAHMDSLGR